VRHTLSVLVENQPGVLARVAIMFRRRGFNIESLAVGPTERHDVSRITLRVDCAEHALEQIEKQIHKLVNVLRVTELAPDDAVERELLLLKVSAAPDHRAELITMAESFRGRVADLGPAAVTFELTGTPEELDAFEELARPHGILELVRTGRVGMARASAKRQQTRRLSAIN
jgi:acetolactate synthase-1/3 small subunit